jgi:hypothetical protein
MENAVRQPNTGLSYGLIAGLIVVLITLSLYLGGIDMYMSPAAFITYLVMITFAVVAALKKRKMNGGYLSFQEALKITFTVFAVALLLQTVFVYILFNFIDVSFKEAMMQASMDKTEQMLRKFGLPDSEIEKATDPKKAMDQFGLAGVFLGYAMTCIVAFIFSLLISIIVKKNKPEFPNS